MVAAIPVVGSSLSASLDELAKILADIARQDIQAVPNIDITVQNIGNKISQTLNFLISIFGPLISMGATVVFTLLISLHLSLSIDLLRDGAKKLIPDAYEPEISELVGRMIYIWQSFLRGQISLMVVVGVLVWFGNLILGTPQALVLGVLAGLLEVIPNLGPVLATTLPGFVRIIPFSHCKMRWEKSA
jgi:predicted PurR-regulated permease PerM